LKLLASVPAAHAVRLSPLLGGYGVAMDARCEVRGAPVDAAAAAARAARTQNSPLWSCSLPAPAELEIPNCLSF
jgi:hypothetical protein